MDNNERRIEAMEVERRFLLDWIRFNVTDDKIYNFFTNHCIEKVILYGMGDLGWFVYELLKRNNITVLCGIDRKPTCGRMELSVKKVEEALNIFDDYDAIIISSIYYCNDIYNTLVEREVKQEKIIGVEDIVYWCSRRIQST